MDPLWPELDNLNSSALQSWNPELVDGRGWKEDGWKRMSGKRKQRGIQKLVGGAQGEMFNVKFEAAFSATRKLLLQPLKIN